MDFQLSKEYKARRDAFKKTEWHRKLTFAGFTFAYDLDYAGYEYYDMAIEPNRAYVIISAKVLDSKGRDMAPDVEFDYEKVFVTEHELKKWEEGDYIGTGWVFRQCSVDEAITAVRNRVQFLRSGELML